MTDYPLPKAGDRVYNAALRDEGYINSVNYSTEDVLICWKRGSGEALFYRLVDFRPGFLSLIR